MKNSLIKKTLTGLLAVALVGIAFQTRAEDKTNAVTATVKNGKLPFSGTLSAVDKTAMTITVKKKESEKTYQVTAATKFIKAGKPATLEDGVVGEIVGGSYKKTEDGKLEALSVRFGPKPESTGGKKKKTEAAATPEKN